MPSREKLSGKAEEQAHRSAVGSRLSSERKRSVSRGSQSRPGDSDSDLGECEVVETQTAALEVESESHSIASNPVAPLVRVAIPVRTVEDMSTHIGDRLIYDFEKQPQYCCDCLYFEQPLVGCHTDVKLRLPVELERKGVGADEWRQWFQDLEHIQSKAPSVCCMEATTFFPLLYLQSVVCCCFCPLSASHCLSSAPCCFGDWHSALGQWMATVNGRLQPLGLFVKILTFPPFDGAPHSVLRTDRLCDRTEDIGYEMSFVVFALTADESKVLNAQPWHCGVKDTGVSNRGRVC